MQLPNFKSIIQDKNKILRITLISGIVILILTTCVLSIFFLMGRNSTKSSRQQETFARLLREYDALSAETTGAKKEYDRLNRELDRLERRAITVESWLSILKRRRALARIHPPSIENYKKSANKALEIYPASQPVAAIAAEILVKDTAINEKTEENLRKILAVFTDSSFNVLRLCLHILLGDFNNPQRASALPSDLFSDGTESVTIDLAILKILRGDIRGAAGNIQTMIQNEPHPVDFLRLAAEFYYDFGELNRSAELFSLIDDEKAMIRQADALYLAGYTESARSIWSILSNSNKPVERSLYNIGVTSQEDAEAVFWFDKLVNLDAAEITDSRQYGLIRYSRLLDETEALTLLGSIENLKPADNPFIDLEICRRQAPNMEIGRQIAEAWLLIDRHDDNDDLYKWAAWLLLFQRNYGELKILLDRIEMLGLSGQWSKIYRAIDSMFAGELYTAEELLRSIPVEDSQWCVYANLGCILEAQRSATRAVEQFGIAAEKTANPKTASRLQMRISRCYTALNRPAESFHALETALELDPENLTARLEFDRAFYSY